MNKENRNNDSTFCLIGSFCVPDNLEIYINHEDKGEEPHFHIRDTELSIQSCVKIKSAEYYFHEEGNIPLENEKVEELNDLMNETLDEIFPSNLTTWQFIVNEWNRNNPNNKIKEVISMPDYTKLLKK